MSQDVPDASQTAGSPSAEEDLAALARVADLFEAELDAFVHECAWCLRRELDGCAQSVAPGQRDDDEMLHGATRAVARDSLARLRGGAPGELPADVVAAARAAARGGCDVCGLVDRYGELLWDRLSRTTEAAVADPALRWRLLKLARTYLAGHLPRLSELFRLICEEESLGRIADDDRLRSNRVALVLRGQLDDLGAVDYDLYQLHTAVVTDSPAVVGQLALASGRQRLHLVQAGQAVCGWIGGRAPLDATRFDELIAGRGLAGARIALGEPGFAVEGFRGSHRQALEAWRVVRAGICRTARYSHVAALIALARDQAIAGDFLACYLEPLDPPLREAAEAYLKAGHNASAAAARLRRSRRTVERQLMRVEDCLGRPITEIAGELCVGFQLADLATFEGWWEAPKRTPAAPGDEQRGVQLTARRGVATADAAGAG